MTILAAMAVAVADIAQRCGDDYNAMTDADLEKMHYFVGVSCQAAAGYLIERCGGDRIKARDEVQSAMSLSSRALHRRAQVFAEAMTADAMPSVRLHAAHVAMVMQQMKTLAAQIERRRLGSAVN